jgi:NADH-quinone oxidoreductase subunit H
MTVQDWIFILGSAVKTGAMIGTILFMVSYTVMAERRVCGLIQDRIGPNRVGIPFTNIRIWGLGQPIADALKLMLKEDFTPSHVNKLYFTLAPALAMMPSLITICVIPFADSLDLRPVAALAAQHWPVIEPFVQSFNFTGVIANLDVGLLFVFAVVSLSVYGIVLAGWASNSKYPFLGGIRASAQMISYELCMGLAVVPIFMLVGNLNLTKIVEYQIQNGWFAFPFSSHNWVNWVYWIPLGISFLLFLVSAFAETNRLPFDLAECETELVGGYHTEYSSMKFALFFLGEYAAMIAVSSVMVTIFFGGWSLPLPWFNGSAMPAGIAHLGGQAMPWWFGFIQIGVLVAKIAVFLFLFIWVRWTLPRFRYDQLMSLGWKFMIPLGFINIFLTAVLMLYLPR